MNKMLIGEQAIAEQSTLTEIILSNENINTLECHDDIIVIKELLL